MMMMTMMTGTVFRRRVLLGATRRRFFRTFTTTASTTTTPSGGVGERGLRASMDAAEAHLSSARPFVAQSAARIVELSAHFDHEDSWQDPGAAAPLARELAALEATSAEMAALELRLSDARELCGMVAAAEEEDEEAREMLLELSDDVSQIVDAAVALSHRVLLSDPEDCAEECFVEIYAGAGGDDAQSFSEMLVGMYTAWAASSPYAVFVDDWNPADVGIRSARLRCTGPAVMGWLAGEAGVQRLVRISPFDSSGRRHTSFARVLVFPSASAHGRGGGAGAATAAAAAAAAAVDAMLNDPAALRVDTFRASGKGGQSVNTTDSAVRMTHLPTGIVASYQGERSQHHNRKRCLAVMRAKLAAHIASEEAVARDEHWRDVRTVENAFGGQFRSYTLDTGIVNDHRTGFKCNGAERVLADGRIGPLLVAGLKHRKGGSA
jgi:peptide chain release factor 2